MDTTRSADLFERASRVIPGGVNSPVRAFGSVGGTPRFIARAAGNTIEDADGNRYVDLVNSWGPLPLGHVNTPVYEAAVEAMKRGSSFGAPTEAEILIAEELIAAVPSVQKVRLVSSGTEATMTCIRLARGFTGRDKILKFAGHYHGHSDSLLVAAGSGVATLGIPGTPGVTAGTAADTIIVPWNDPAAVEAAIAEHGADLALIVCEPVPANMNLVPPAAGFLQLLRDVATRCGALLLFDEVITGFRLGRGGAQAMHGVTPDLTALGKAIGGGFPIAAFGGRADVMDHLAPVGPVYQAGTLSGNPVAVAAGIAQLAQLTPEVYATLDATATALTDTFTAAFAHAGIADAQVLRHGTLLGIVFGLDAAPTVFEDMQGADHDRYGRFFHAMLDHGVYLAPSGYEVVFPSVAIDDEAMATIGAAATAAARAIA